VFDVARRLGNARVALKRHGFAEYSLRLARRAGEIAYRRHAATVFRLELQCPPPLLDARVDVEIVLYAPRMHSELHRFLGVHLRPDIIDGRLADGWTPALCFFDGRIVALSWFATSPIYLESLECILDYGAGVGYIEGSRTDAEMKGLGLAPAIRSRICRHLYEVGCREVYVCVGDDNASSQAVARKCGFTTFESVVLTRVLWYRHYRRTRHQTGSA
jgi:hypothetical protein